jgi:hypothetical protein
MYVTPGAEITSSPMYHYTKNIIGINQGPKKITQFGIRFKGKRVFSFRSIQRDTSYTLTGLPQKVLC